MSAKIVSANVVGPSFFANKSSSRTSEKKTTTKKKMEKKKTTTTKKKMEKKEVSSWVRTATAVRTKNVAKDSDTSTLQYPAVHCLT